MVICERLCTQDYSLVFYVTKHREKDYFMFYVPGGRENDYLWYYLAENGIDGFFEIYTRLKKMRYERLPNYYIDAQGVKCPQEEWKTPPFHRAFYYSYAKVMEKAKERAKEGKRTRVRMKAHDKQ